MKTKHQLVAVSCHNLMIILELFFRHTETSGGAGRAGISLSKLLHSHEKNCWAATSATTCNCSVIWFPVLLPYIVLDYRNEKEICVMLRFFVFGKLTIFKRFL